MKSLVWHPLNPVMASPAGSSHSPLPKQSPPKIAYCLNSFSGIFKDPLSNYGHILGSFRLGDLNLTGVGVREIIQPMPSATAVLDHALRATDPSYVEMTVF